MRIVLVTGEYPPHPGGVGDYTYRLMLALDNQGDTLHAITFQDQRWCLYAASATTPEQMYVPVRMYARQRSFAWGWQCWSNIISLLDQLHPDVVHIQYQTGAYGMHPAINFLPWRLRGLGQRPRILVTLHDLREPYLFPKAGFLRRYVTLRLAQDADAVIVTNTEDQAGLQATSVRQPGMPGYLAKGTLSATVIPIGSNIPVAPPPAFARAAWRKRMGIPPSACLVAYFGLLSYSKGFDLLLDAIACLNSRKIPGGDYRLVLIGGAATTPTDRAYAASIAVQIERLGLNNILVQTGHIDEASVSAHLLAADCLVLPFRDGASFRRGSLLAGLAHGQAVITTTPAYMPDARSPRLIDGENVLLVPPGQTQSLIAAIERLWKESVLRVRLGSGAQKLARQFDWSVIARQHTQVYMPQSTPARWRNA